RILAGAGGFEPPYGGIKIRCLATWLRPNDAVAGKLPGMPLAGNKAASSAPPQGLGCGKRRARLFGGSAIAEQSKAGRAAAAHPRQQNTGEGAKPRQHR